MNRHPIFGFGFAALIVATGHLSSFGQVLFQEDFEGVTLGPSVNELSSTAIETLGPADANFPSSSPVPGVWSSTAPTGWVVDNTLSTYNNAPTITPGVPGTGLADYGVDEWEGWNFSRIDFWAAAAGGQDREFFGDTSNASGTVAVADPDEYFDLGDDGGPNNAANGGYYSSSITTVSFPVNANDIHFLGFDSSWRDEAFDDEALGGTFVDVNNQAVEIIATFDVGGSQQVTAWNSDSNDGAFKDDAPDENFAADGTGPFAFFAPAGASSATLTFSIANAGNDWWWAIDNVEVNGATGAADQKLFEDFEGITLGDSVNERLSPNATVTDEEVSVTTVLGVDYPNVPIPDAFTHTGPAGWSVDNTGTPFLGKDDIGVFEWEGWSFASKDFWNNVSGNGTDFELGTGNVAVADGDEWDDLGDSDPVADDRQSPDDTAPLQTLLETPSIDLTSLGPNQTLEITFDSSWREEDDQTATLSVLLDGDETEILRWESEDGDAQFFKADAQSETVLIELDPAGASSLALKFGYSGSNDWWWAIDNVQVTAVPEPTSVGIIGLAIGLGLFTIRKRSK